MTITKIVINNFKSIGEQKNVLYLDKSVSVIIGKNESGKSNLLDCLSALKFFTISKLNANKNKLNGKIPEISVELELSESDINNFECSFDEVSCFEFSDSKFPCIKGGLASFISEKIAPIQKYLLDAIKSIGGLSNDTKKSYIEYFSTEFNTDMLKHKQRIQSMKEFLNNKSLTFPDKEDFKAKLLEYEQHINNIERILPIFFKVDEKEFSSSYSAEEFKKNITQQSIINSFFKSAEIELEDVVKAVTSSDAGEKQFYQEQIAEKLKKLSEEFSEFYQKEKVFIKLNYETNKFHLLVDTETTKRPMYVTERSNGLRWYLNLYIQLKEQNLLDKNVVLLIDEPGTCLHIDAQAKLVDLFKDFGTKNQILYTTHSPFMIDSSYLSNIRLVCNVNGYTHIFNSVSDLKVPESSKTEVLSPLCKALGFSVKYNIGPSYSKENIIVEGITDYYYLKGAMKYFNISEDVQPHILPSIGVTNINRIASILIGWGCSFKIMIDYDEQAYYEYERLCKLGLTERKDIFTVSCREVDRDEMFSSPVVIEDLFEVDDKLQFDCGEKTLNAKRFLELTESENIILNPKSVENLKCLLRQLGINIS